MHDGVKLQIEINPKQFLFRIEIQLKESHRQHPIHDIAKNSDLAMVQAKMATMRVRHVLSLFLLSWMARRFA